MRSSSASNVRVMLVGMEFVGVAGRDDDGVFSLEEDLELKGDISVLEWRINEPKSASGSDWVTMWGEYILLLPLWKRRRWGEGEDAACSLGDDGCGGRDNWGVGCGCAC